MQSLYRHIKTKRINIIISRLISTTFYLKELFGGYKKQFFYLLLLLIIGSILQYIFPFLTQAIVDNGIRNKDITLIKLILLGQITFFLGQTFVNILKNWLILRIGSNINIKVTKSFIKKLLKTPIHILETRTIGDLIQRIMDIRRIDNFLTNSVFLALFSIMNILVYSIIIFNYSYKIFLLHVLSTLLSIIWIKLFLLKRKQVDYNYFEANSSNHNKIVQIINGIKDIKLSNAEIPKLKEWEDCYHISNNLKLKSLLINQYQQFGFTFLSQLRNIVITFIAANLVVEGSLTLGAMLAISFINGQLSAPIDQLLGLAQSYQDASISFDRLNEIQGTPDESTNDIKVKNIIIDDIIISNLNFKYSNSKENALQNINILIEKGKTTAIVGKSGHGKTTIIKLLLKYYNTYQGSILLGNTDLKSISNFEWRDKCSYVIPDGYIFTDSITNNIALSNKVVDLSKVKEATRIANVYDFIQSLDKRFDTVIGTNMKGISEGQKQRILIARALYKSPNYIFLDEATNYLDSENELIIVNNLKKMINMTTIYISHRLSTIKKADKIIVLEYGKVMENGSHEELVKSKYIYYNLFKNQLE